MDRANDRSEWPTLPRPRAGSPGPGAVHATARLKRASRQPNMTIAAGGPKFASPIAGSVLRIHKGVGDAVAIGDPVMVVEAMKL